MYIGPNTVTFATPVLVALATDMPSTYISVCNPLLVPVNKCHWPLRN
jgi:hypothetical protein